MAGFAVPLIGAAASLLGGLFGGGAFGDQIKPQAADPIWPWMQKPFGDWLFSGFQQKPDGGWDLSGVPGYSGQLTPSFDQTILPNVYNSWQPMDAGTMYLANATANNGLGIGDYSPLAQSMMSYGGTGGPGNNYMNLMAQYGTPSQVGQPLQSMVQTGMSSPGAGGALQNFAQGNPVGAAAYLAPFLTGQSRNNYSIPQIQPMQVQRRA